MMRAIWAAGAMLCVAGFLTAGMATRPTEDAVRVLVFSKTAGFRHGSIPAGIACITKLGEDNDYVYRELLGWPVKKTKEARAALNRFPPPRGQRSLSVRRLA